MFVAIGILVGLVVGTATAMVAVKLLGSTSLGAAQRNRKLVLDQAERDAERAPGSGNRSPGGRSAAARGGGA